jgi:4-oxalocrotonate tautomerase family enzyme
VPVAHIYVTECTDAQERRLHEEGSRRYASVLGSPLDRVRLFVHHLPPTGVSVGGETVAETGRHSPYFTALILRGRPVAQRHELLRELTDLVVEILGAGRGLVRGLITEVDPDGWGVGGVPASVVRARETAARTGVEGAR